MKRKEVFKVPVEIHNYWHKKFKRHEITIEDLIAVGVSRANAYIIKKYPAYYGPATSGPKPKIPVDMAGTIVSKASNGSYESMPVLLKWVEDKIGIRVCENTLRKFFLKRGYHVRVRRHIIRIDKTIARERLREARKYKNDKKLIPHLIVSDETTHQECTVRREYTMRAAGQGRLLKHCTVHVKKSRFKINVFGVASKELGLKIFTFDGNNNAENYIKCLRNVVVPFIK